MTLGFVNNSFVEHSGTEALNKELHTDIPLTDLSLSSPSLVLTLIWPLLASTPKASSPARSVAFRSR